MHISNSTCLTFRFYKLSKDKETEGQTVNMLSQVAAVLGLVPGPVWSESSSEPQDRFEAI